MKRIGRVFEQMSDFRSLEQAAHRAFRGVPATKMVQAVKKAGGDVRYTEYAGTGHNSWDKAYEEKEAIKWLLSQRKK